MAWDVDRVTEVLLEAGAMALDMQRGIATSRKSDRSLVTEADHGVEKLLSDAFERPEAGAFIIGEETSHLKGEDYLARALANEAFVIDPIDGTSPYAHQLPTWGVSMGRLVEGRLVDGAVFLPAVGELVISSGTAALEARFVRTGEDWTAASEFSETPDPTPDPAGERLLAITQDLAKRGRVELPNPTLVLGAAVVPLVGLLQGRFSGYLGSVRLWDAAGALALLLRKGFSVTVAPGGVRCEVSGEVSDRTYVLEPGHPRRWRFLSDLLVCHPEDEERLRRGLVRGD